MPIMLRRVDLIAVFVVQVKLGRGLFAEAGRIDFEMNVRCAREVPAGESRHELRAPVFVRRLHATAKAFLREVDHPFLCSAVGIQHDVLDAGIVTFVVGMPDQHLGAGEGFAGQDVLDLKVERERHAVLPFHQV